MIGVLLVAGIVARAVVTERVDATEDIRERSAAALVVAERLRAALSRADATAAADVFGWIDLVPSQELSASQRRENYDRMKTDGYYTGDHGDAPAGGGSGAGASAGVRSETGAGAGTDAPTDADTEVDARQAPPNDYSAAIRAATTTLLDLRQADPGECRAADEPDSTHCAMNRLATLVPEHVGLVAEARANNRAGNTVGGVYLRLASDLMSGTILDQTDLLVAAYGDRVDRDYRRATGGGGENLLLVVLGSAFVVLVGAQVYVFRRTRRIINLGLLGATCVLVVVGVGCLVQLGAQQSRLSDAERDNYVPMTLLAASRTLALQARTYELLSLMSLGNGDYADAGFRRVLDGLGFGPDGRPLPAAGTPGALSAALAELPDARESLTTEFTEWLRVRREVVDALDRPPRPTGATTPDVFDDAIDTTLRSEHFDRFITQVDGLLESRRAGFDADLAVAAGKVRAVGVGIPVALVVAAGCCAAGIGARMREYG